MRKLNCRAAKAGSTAGQPSCSAPAQVTLLREYAQGVNQLAYSLPAGAFDPRKHATAEDCARGELSEEVRPLHLAVGSLIARLGFCGMLLLLEPPGCTAGRAQAGVQWLFPSMQLMVSNHAAYEKGL